MPKSKSFHPTTIATNKHDLLCARSISHDLSLDAASFSSSSELFRKVIRYDDTDSSHGKPESKAFIYSYKDGPEYPGPLARTLLVLGYADRSLNVVRKIIDTEDGEAAICDGLHSCTIAVQLGDEPKRMQRMEKRHKVNSTSFAKYIQSLRKSRKVAILAKDKYDRFGIMVPFEQEETNAQTGFGNNDFAARIHVGDVREVMKFLAASSGSRSHEEWRPTTPPLPPTKDGSWKPSTPPLPSNPWDNDEDDNDGPTFRPDNDDDDGPVFRPDDGDDGWKPTTPPVPSQASGMPWDAADASNGTGGRAVMPWEAAGGDGDNNGNGTNDTSSSMPWENATDEIKNESASMPWETGGGATDNGNDEPSSMPWEREEENEHHTTSNNTLPWSTNSNDNEFASSNKKRSHEDMTADETDTGDEAPIDINSSKFHANTGAAAADAFYSGLTRNLSTRDKSILYHMKCFNNWVKATQIAELDPNTGTYKQALRVLDLACGKGGDLTKWTIHSRGLRNYVGIDVARGSLKDAAERARSMRKRKILTKAVFSCADLGSDVPGRKRSPQSKGLQKLLTWSLEDEAPFETGEPNFQMLPGGGISPSESFDIVSIQFAIHYMMQTGQRARRFFHTVSQLLDIGGNLAFTTIDARVIVDHMMNLGLNFHFEDGKEPEFDQVVVEAGGGACQLKFEPHIVKKLLQCQADGTKGEESLFGLEYTFTLVEGEDHAAGMGDAVNLPEWLIPIPVLVALGKEAGLELEYAQNFHEFYQARSDPSTHAASHMLLSNMKVPNRHGTISDEEWSISRLYLAVKFRKVRESSIVIEDDGAEYDEEEVEEDRIEKPPEPKIQLDPLKAKMMYPKAMMKAKRTAGAAWPSLSREQKEELTQAELRKLAAI